jgi:hypothetical protein
MSDKKSEPTAEERHTTLLLGLVLSLRSMALDLLEKGQTEEARGLVDTIETLDVKTRGNVSAEEAKIFEQVLYELRMAVVAGPRKAPETEEAAAPNENGAAEEAATQSASEADCEEDSS